VDEGNKLWGACADALRRELPEGTWQMWLANLSPVSFHDGIMLLGVPNGIVRERVESRFLPLITDGLSAAANGPVEVQLQVVGADAAGHARVPSLVHSTLGPGSSGPPQGSADATSGRPTATASGDRAGAPVGATSERFGRAQSSRDGAAVSIDSRFTFDSFVAASSNRLAKAAAQSVAENPGGSYNPLFLYGGSGLGKTHLLHAIGNYVQQHFARHRVVYLTTETFMNDFVDALRRSTTIAFKRRYRDCDVLLIDDIQFLENKESLQEEFFHTYNDLHGSGKQIVLASDRAPKSIETLEYRLRSRFLSGLITKIDPPDLETRLAILRSKAESTRDHVPDDVLELIATHVQDNIRELEGALTRVTACANLNNEPPTVQLAEEVLSDLIGSNQPRQITPQTIMDVAARHFGITCEALCSPVRTRPLVNARQVAMYLVRNLTDYSYPAIGNVFGGRDHTTVIHAVNKIEAQMRERRQTYEQVTDLLHQIKSGA